MKCSISLLVVLAFTLLLSCKDGGNSDENQDSIVELGLDTNSNASNPEYDIMYCVSTPSEIIEAINETDLKFNADLLHNYAKSKNYLVQTSQALNLGIYSADLTYSAYYDQMNYSAYLFSSVRDLSEKLQVNDLINDIQLARVKANLHNPDSIKEMANEYNKIIYQHFFESNKENILILITTGGFVESLYLALNSVKDFKPKSPVSQVLAEQKYIFEVLRNYTYQKKDDPIVLTVIDDIKTLDAIFSEVVPEKKEKTTVENVKGKIVIGGKNNIYLDQAQFNKLKTTITEIRTKYTKLQ